MGETFPIRFGRYELVERLAVGGMAELFRATADGEHGFAKGVVIKRLLPHLARESGYTAMFIDEAKLTARLVHPKIAQTYELGRVDDQLFIAMELVDGVDVLALLREYAHRRERVPVDLAVWIAHEVVDALDYAHQLRDVEGSPMGIVHRDISPSNILLSRRGDVKLVDFGIARATEPGRHHRTKSGTLKGKYGYMSPEQVLEQSVDARSDLFSLGIVLAEMLCGRRLFAAPNELDVLLMVRDAKLVRLDEHGKHIEPDLDAIVRKTLKKDPNERWSSAGELRDALEDWLFQQRLRVTPKKVAETVENVYDQVAMRRRATITDEVPVIEEASAVIEAPRVPRAPTSADSPRALRGPAAVDALTQRSRPQPIAADDSDGVPRGLYNTTDSLPVITIEDPASQAISVAAVPVARVPVATVPARKVATVPPREPTPVVRVPPVAVVPPRETPSGVMTAPTPAAAARKVATVPPRTATQTVPPLAATPKAPAPASPSPAPASPTPSPPLDLGLDELPVLELAPPTRPPRRGLPAAPLGGDDESFERALAELDLLGGDEEDEVTPVVGLKPSSLVDAAIAEVVPIEPSMRYASIEAAVSALSRKPPDESALEFDGGVVGPRKRTGEMPVITEEELARAPSRLPPALAEIEDTPEENGDFTVIPPLKLLYWLTSTRKTGLLVVTIGAIKKEIYVRDGMPEYVSSNVSSELLGNWLVAQGVLSQGELAMALAMMPHYGGKLGDTLVGLGLLKPLEVFRHLTRQVRQKLIDVCTWSKGHFSWYAHRANPREAFPLDLNAFEVLGAGAMAVPDGAVDAWMERWGDAHLKATKGGKFSPDRFELAGLRNLYDGLDGRKTVTQAIARYDHAERRRATRMLMLLEMCELARV